MDKLMEKLRKDAEGIANTTAHFMLLAEKYASAGDLTGAKACLLLLCENCDNYEESLAWNELTDKWQQYRYIVEGLVPPSVRFCSAAPCQPDRCSMQIPEIFALPEAEMLTALSEHLDERSAGGEDLTQLNHWEQVVFYADQLCAEVNSGGFDSYLYYYGLHFEKAYEALQTIAAENTLRILDAVREKFPRKRIPKKEESLQNAMDKLQDKGIDFEAEDDRFYETGEKELLERLLIYCKENRARFR